MKTEKEIRKEIQDLLFKATLLKPSDKLDKKQLKEIKLRVKFLKPILLYLETNPTQEFCEAELAKSKMLLTAANSNYVPLEGRYTKADTAKKKAFETKLDIPTIKTHIKNLKFILDK